MEIYLPSGENSKRIIKRLVEDITIRKKEKVSCPEYKRLNDLWNYCVKYIPYYAYVAAFLPKRFEMDEWPVLTKSMSRLAGFSLINSKRCQKITCLKRTSGTTGESLRIFFDDRSMYRNWAYIISALEAAHNFKVNGSSQPPWLLVNFGTHSRLKYIYRENCLPYNGDYCSCPMDDRSIVRLSQYLSNEPRRRIAYWNAAPSTFKLLIRKLENHKLSHKLKPNGIIVSGEAFMESLRRELSEYFGCLVTGLYSSAEFGPIAYECGECDGYHFDPLTFNIDAPVDKDGSITITSWRNLTMPLFKYETGDLGSLNLEKCSCGSMFPRINITAGKKIYYFMSINGELVNPYPLLDLLHEKSIEVNYITQSENYIISFWSKSKLPEHERIIVSRMANNVFVGQKICFCIGVPNIINGLKHTSLYSELSSMPLSELSYDSIS